MVEALLGNIFVVDPDVLEILGFGVDVQGSLVDGNTNNETKNY